ncbi:hypothetical protein CRG98_018981 [Punica granatum]|uniref:RNase H type-1 domain-containing protein n=1 Tax=Punica granatum TaxID=22663 RepID=A0A2I0JWF9_PUNGR|nr:hypothetical protein CRG98_018981 [Punica granatum]
MNHLTKEKITAEALVAIQRLLECYAKEAQEVSALESQPEIVWDDLEEAPSKLEDLVAEVQVPPEEFNLGTAKKPLVIYVSKLLSPKLKESQTVADFLADHQCLYISDSWDEEVELLAADIVDWQLAFDWSSTRHLLGEYGCTSPSLLPHFAVATQLIDEFERVQIHHVGQARNSEANELARLAVGMKLINKGQKKFVQVERREMPVLRVRGIQVAVISTKVDPTDWRYQLIHYLRDPNLKVKDFAGELGIKLITCTSYYAQANGQADASNKVIINIIEKSIESNPRGWHDKLSKALCAYRTSKRDATGATQFSLTFGHDVFLPLEINVRSARVDHQHGLTHGDYTVAMMVELDDLD